MNPKHSFAVAAAVVGFASTCPAVDPPPLIKVNSFQEAVALETNPAVPDEERKRALAAALSNLAKSGSADERIGVSTLNTDLADLKMVDRDLTVTILKQLLADIDPRVRDEALCSCIGCTGLGQTALPALPEILALRRDPDPGVRRRARFVSRQMLQIPVFVSAEPLGQTLPTPGQ